MAMEAQIRTQGGVSYSSPPPSLFLPILTSPTVILSSPFPLFLCKHSRSVVKKEQACITAFVNFEHAMSHSVHMRITVYKCYHAGIYPVCMTDHITVQSPVLIYYYIAPPLTPPSLLILHTHTLIFLQLLGRRFICEIINAPVRMNINCSMVHL